MTANPNDYDALFDLSVHQIAQYQYNEAIDNLLFILEKESEYKEGAAKEVVITVANMIAPVDADLSKEIRRKLSNLLAN